jgi:hypothetical protein
VDQLVQRIGLYRAGRASASAAQPQDKRSGEEPKAYVMAAAIAAFRKPGTVTLHTALRTPN